MGGVETKQESLFTNAYIYSIVIFLPIPLLVPQVQVKSHFRSTKLWHQKFEEHTQLQKFFKIMLKKSFRSTK